MFKSSGSNGKSVQEYVEQNVPKEKEIEPHSIKEHKKNIEKMEKQVKKKLDLKSVEFCFEVSKEKKHFKELDDLQEMIDRGNETMVLLLKAGKVQEARMLKKKVKDTMYAKEHLSNVMNLDFTKPT